MSTVDLVSKVEELKELEALVRQAEAEIETLKDEIKQEMVARDTEEMEVGRYVIRWKSVENERFDTTAFKKANPTIYEMYLKWNVSRRFTVTG